MITVLIVTILATLIGAVEAKGWFGAGLLSGARGILIRMLLAVAGFLGFELGDIVHGESSFFEAILTYIGIACGVVSSYTVMFRAFMKLKPVFADDISFVGNIVATHFGKKACQILYIGEVVFYLITVLL